MSKQKSNSPRRGTREGGSYTQVLTDSPRGSARSTSPRRVLPRRVSPSLPWKRFVSLVLLFIIAMSAANTLLMLSMDVLSRSLIFYVVAFVATPLTMFVVSYFSITRRSVFKSILVSLFSICVLLFYRWILFPFYPTEVLLAESDRISLCQPGVHSIEAVYTWVNVTDVKWQNVCASFGCDVSFHQGSVGDADPFEALKYSMRSMVAHFPYVSKYLIVTERDQVPAWLDLSDPMVSVVFHDEFMPPEAAPVFNSNPTEYLLYRLKEKGFIKGNCFVYMNDDFIINKPLKFSDLVSETGQIVFHTVTHISLPNKAYIDVPFGMWDIQERGSAATITDPHVPYIVNVDAFEAYMAKCGDVCKSYLGSRCRRAGPLPMETYQQFMATDHSYLLEFVSPLLALTMRLPMGSPALSPWINKALLMLLNPKFAFIESHDGVEDNPAYVDMINSYLKDSFPTKSKWEV